MKKLFTRELIGPALDWAVTHCENTLLGTAQYDSLAEPEEGQVAYRPSTEWNQGGPIIDREDITWSMNMEPEHGNETRFCAFSYRAGSSKAQAGPTKLIAAMRCYVASKLGDEIDIPEELL